MLTHIKSLEAFGVSGNLCEIFTLIILFHLPDGIQIRGMMNTGDLNWLERFSNKKSRPSRGQRPWAMLQQERRRIHIHLWRWNFDRHRSQERKIVIHEALHTFAESECLLCGFCRCIPQIDVSRSRKNQDCQIAFQVLGQRTHCWGVPCKFSAI